MQCCSGVALYPIYCLINHACVNNTNYVKFPDYHLELRSQLAIKKGEEITTRYISSTIGKYSLSNLHVSELMSAQLQATFGGEMTSSATGTSIARACAAGTPPSWAPSCRPYDATCAKT